MLKREIAIKELNADENVLDFIKNIYNYGDNVFDLFSAGYCYYFSLILKARFPEAEIFLSENVHHFITKINNCYYDIDGAVYDDACFEGLIPLEKIDEKTLKNYMH